MKNLLVLILIALTLGASHPRSAPSSAIWNLYSFNGSAKYPKSPTDMTFVFPEANGHVAFPAFLTTTVDTSVLGNLTSKTVSANLTVEAQPNTLFVFGGEIPGWNTGPVPANCRIFVSSSASAYNLNTATANEDNYWWSHVGVAVISNNTVNVIISDTFDPSHWSNANGHYGNDPSHIAGFNAAVANVRQIGLSFGGGNYYDVGVAIRVGTGPATFRLLSVTAQ